jgi:hypothetical protein
MKTISVLLSLLLLCATAAVADTAATPSAVPAPTNSSLSLQGAPNPFSLLDLSRIRRSHSYSISYFSGGSSSGSAGLLNSTMFYDISRSLSLSVNIGVLHNSGSIWGDSKNDATILPGFRLDYHPSEKFRMSIAVQRVSGLYPYYYDRGGWFSPAYAY